MVLLSSPRGAHTSHGTIAEAPAYTHLLAAGRAERRVLRCVDPDEATHRVAPEGAHCMAEVLRQRGKKLCFWTLQAVRGAAADVDKALS